MTEYLELEDFFVDPEKIDWPAVGKDLRTLRNMAGLTQQELSDQSGAASRQYISDIERGKRQPSPGIIHRLLDTLTASIPASQLEEYEAHSEYVQDNEIEPRLAGVWDALTESMERVFEQADQIEHVAGLIAKTTGVPHAALRNALSELTMAEALAFLHGIDPNVIVKDLSPPDENDIVLIGYIFRRLWSRPKEELTRRDVWFLIRKKPEIESHEQMDRLLKLMEALGMIKLIDTPHTTKINRV